MGQCGNCKEYYCPTEIKIFETDLSNSQSSTFRNFKNPFFPIGIKINQFLTENNEVNNNEVKNNKGYKKEVEPKKGKKEKKEKKQEQEKKKNELNELKNKIIDAEKQNGKNIIFINNNVETNNINVSNSLDNLDNINNIDMESSQQIRKEKEINTKINQTLENMCIMGDIMKKEISEEKKTNPKKFISTSEALNLKDEDEDFFVLGLLAKSLEDIGIETAIEKETNEDEQDASTTCLQYIVNGFAQKKKYDLHFEFGKERNEQLLMDKDEFENFKKNMKKKLSKDYHISEDKIIVAFPQKGSFHVQVIFQSDEFNDLNLEEFKEKFKNDDEFEELKNLKEIQTDIILGGCKLSKNLLDNRENRTEGWAKKEKCGGRTYIPPEGWIGIGLNILDKYESNDWLLCDNSPGEWCIAYQRVGKYLESGGVGVTDKIINGPLTTEQNQIYKKCENINKPGTKIGEGVYYTPNIDIAASYSSITKIKGKSYQIVLMVRIKPDAIRECLDCEDYWVVNGTTDEIRPYKILYKCFDQF